MIMKKIRLRLAVIVSALVFAGTAHATITTYTDSGSFLTALPGASSTVDFEGAAAGTTGATLTIGGITFTPAGGAAGFDLVVTDQFSQTTPSGEKYLGIDDGADEVFFSGDILEMNLGGPTVAIGLFVIGTPGDVLADDFELTAGAGAVMNAGTPELTLGDGGEAFFLGLIEDDPTMAFTTASLTSFDPDELVLFFFNVDDVTVATVATAPTVPVPEPGALAAFAVGLLAMGTMMRRRKVIAA